METTKPVSVRLDPALELSARMRGDGRWRILRDGAEVGTIAREHVRVGSAGVRRRRVTFTTSTHPVERNASDTRVALHIMAIAALVGENASARQSDVFAFLATATVEAAA